MHRLKMLNVMAETLSKTLKKLMPPGYHFTLVVYDAEICIGVTDDMNLENVKVMLESALEQIEVVPEGMVH